MTSLADRVRGIIGAVGPPGPVATDSQPVCSDALAPLGGAWCDGCFVVERQWERSARHGHQTVGVLARHLGECVSQAKLFAGEGACTPFVFFDLETTGLNGGAGTHAFLVGCGRFDECDSFVTRQFLLVRAADERAMLAHVARELARAGALVTFNGKSFDASLLETRYLYHRLEWAGGDLPHFDVLHPARRFWSPVRRGAQAGDTDCSLAGLERRLVGATRKGDVAGFEIPSRYFHFVRTGDARPLIPVLEHNRLDLLSLAALASRLLYLTRVGPDAVRTSCEALALGRTYMRAGDEERARAAFAKSIDMSRAPAGAFDPIKAGALQALALAWRRARRFDEAALCWRQLVDMRGCPSSLAREAAEALAIHHEHRLRDLSAAKAFALLGLGIDPQPAQPTWTRSIHHRLARLDRKLEARTLNYEL